MFFNFIKWCVCTHICIFDNVQVLISLWNDLERNFYISSDTQTHAQLLGTYYNMCRSTFSFTIFSSTKSASRSQIKRFTWKQKSIGYVNQVLYFVYIISSTCTYLYICIWTEWKRTTVVVDASWYSYIVHLLLI